MGLVLSTNVLFVNKQAWRDNVWSQTNNIYQQINNHPAWINLRRTCGTTAGAIGTVVSQTAGGMGNTVKLVQGGTVEADYEQIEVITKLETCVATWLFTHGMLHDHLWLVAIRVPWRERFTLSLCGLSNIVYWRLMIILTHSSFLEPY